MIADLTHRFPVGPTDALASLRSNVEHGRFQRMLAIVTAFFAALAGGEAFFEHLRGSFCQRVMWTPVWISPLVVGAGIGAALDARLARLALPITSAASLIDGVLGFYLHVREVGR